ncbi:hypothetical protein HOG29_02865 [bacterium]|jgi:hypothetical protein|nr:hypothetical protein [bacterium]
MTTIRRKHHKHRPHSKLAQRRKKLLMFKISGIVVAILLIVTGIVFGLRSERINIADINIKGNSALATKVLTGFTEDIISGNFAFVFPKSSIFLYPREDLQASLLNSFKEIKEVDVSFDSLQSISVNIEERKPYALYCGEYFAHDTDQTLIVSEEVASSTSENMSTIVVEEGSCYFLDEDGLIFTKAPVFSGNVYLRYFGSISEDEVIGSQFMQSEDFHETNFFLASLVELGLNPVTFSIVNKDDFEITLLSGGKIMFGKKQSLSNIYENIQSVFGSEEFDEDSLEVLDYADFRFGNKVYFKFK